MFVFKPGRKNGSSADGPFLACVTYFEPKSCIVFRILQPGLAVIKLNHQKHSNGHGRHQVLPCVMGRASSDGMAGYAAGTTAPHGRLLTSDFRCDIHPSKAKVAVSIACLLAVKE